MDDRVEKKLDAIGQDITEIKVTIATNTESLKEHMRRTEILEKVVAPIHSHMIFISYSLKLIAAVAIIIGLLASVSQIMEFLHVK